MDSPNYENKISEFRARVGQYAKLDNPPQKEKSVISMPKINIKSPVMYVIPPILILFLLLVVKPPFVCTDHIDKDNVITKKYNIKKLLITTIIGGIITSVAIFAYFKK